MSFGTLPLSAPTDSAEDLVAAIDFASKGLSEPRVVEYHSPSGRLVLKATFNGPKTGWPVLDRRAMERIAGTQELGTSKPGVPICLGDGQDAVSFPLPVVIIITLLQPGSASDAYLQIVRAHSQLYVNNFRPFQLPVAFWRAAEGIWILVRDEGEIGLPRWWAEHVQPKIRESETLWRVTRWRRRSSNAEFMPLEKDVVPARQPETQKASAATYHHPEDQITGVQSSERWAQDSTDTAPSKRVGVDEEEDEAMTTDRGWLGAVEILIQMADILLVSRHTSWYSGGC
jgi:hypothetical protein